MDRLQVLPWQLQCFLQLSKVRADVAMTGEITLKRTCASDRRSERKTSCGKICQDQRGSSTGRKQTGYSGDGCGDYLMD